MSEALARLRATVLAAAALGLAACDGPRSPLQQGIDQAAAVAAPATRRAAELAGDTATTGRIKAAIAADAGLKDTDISVTTTQGVVVLEGTVKSRDQAAIALDLAQRQQGVHRVESRLAVR